jgi:hypothetical protein
MTPLDALDTMLIVGMKGKRRRPRLVAPSLSFDRDGGPELRMRSHARRAAEYLDHRRRTDAEAEDLGTRLLPVFDSHWHAVASST